MRDLIEKRLRHVARIIGPTSAAAKALAEYDARKAKGENVTIFESGSSLIVGPPRSAQEASHAD